MNKPQYKKLVKRSQPPKLNKLKLSQEHSYEQKHAKTVEKRSYEEMYSVQTAEQKQLQRTFITQTES
jgi:hypothetical protein